MACESKGTLQEFEVAVTGIEKCEYIQAGRLVALRLYRSLAVVMVIFCGWLLLTGGEVTAYAFAAPVGIYVLVLVIAECYFHFSYSGQWSNISGLAYQITPKGWAVVSGEERAFFKWEATPRVQQTKDCLFLYNQESRSSLIPRRLITPEQESVLLQYYQDSRPAAKAYQKKQEKLEKERRRKKGSAFGRMLSGRRRR